MAGVRRCESTYAYGWAFVWPAGVLCAAPVPLITFFNEGAAAATGQPPGAWAVGLGIIT